MGRPTRLPVLTRALVLTGVVMLALASCAPSEPAEGALLLPDGTQFYTDGTYRATFSHTGPDGWQPVLELTVRAGLIEDVHVDAAGADAAGSDGTWLSLDERFAEEFQLQTGSNLEPVLRGFERALVERQQLPLLLRVSELGDVLGWINSFSALAATALSAARDGDTVHRTVLQTGPYEATDRPDELGWRARLTLGFDTAGIATAAFEETRLNADGSWSVKATNEDYVEAYGRVMGLSPAQVAAELSRQIVAAPPAEVNPASLQLDGLSGATGTTSRFQDLARQILSSRLVVELPHKLPRP